MKTAFIIILLPLVTCETGTIFKKTFAHWRESKIYNSELDIRKNLKRDSNNDYIDTHSYYLVQSSKCDLFQPSQVLCVECQKFTKLQRKKDKCTGEGLLHKITHFTDLVQNRCRGKWIKLTPTLSDTCYNSTLAQYVFL